MAAPMVSSGVDVWEQFGALLQSFRLHRLRSNLDLYLSTPADRIDRRRAACFVIAGQPFFGGRVIVPVPNQGKPQPVGYRHQVQEDKSC